MKKHTRVWFVVLKSRTMKVALFVLCCAMLLSFNFGGESLASVFVQKTRKLPIYCVQNDQKEIAISFDAAWGSDKTESILKILDEQQIKANFFLVGMWVDKNEELVKRIDEQGLEIGTHSNTHPDFVKLSAEQMELELSTSKKKITKVTGKEVKLFRAPFGSYNNQVLSVAEKQNLKTIQWDVDSLDWKGISAEKIAANVLKKVQSGSIILCHNNADHIVDSLPTIITTLKSRGYKFVTISELLLDGNTRIDHTGRQIAC